MRSCRKRWKLLFGRPAPKSLRRKFMARAVAYQMQVAAYGGLSAATRRRLREIAMAVRNGDRNGVLGGVQIKPGTQLIRQWQNTTHTVMVLDDGFALDAGLISRSPRSPRQSPAPTGTDTHFSESSARPAEQGRRRLETRFPAYEQPDSEADARVPFRNSNERDSRA